MWLGCIPCERSSRAGLAHYASNMEMLISSFSICTHRSIPETHGCGLITSFRKCHIDVSPFCSWMLMLVLEVDRSRVVLAPNNQQLKTTTVPRCGRFWRNITWLPSICLPCSMLPRVVGCQVLYSAGKRLQCNSVPGKRDHLPVQLVFKRKQTLHERSGHFKWDRNALVSGVYWKDFIGQNFWTHVRKTWRNMILQPIDQTRYERSSTEPYWMVACVFTSHGPNVKMTHQIQSKRARTWLNAERHWCPYLRLFHWPMSLEARFPTQYLQLCYSDGLRWFVSGKPVPNWMHLQNERDRQAGNTQLVHGFELFWRKRDFANVWATSRLLSGKSIGPQKRVYNKPIKMRPVLEEWDEHLAKPGRDGGWLAFKVRGFTQCAQDLPIRSVRGRLAMRPKLISGVCCEFYMSRSCEKLFLSGLPLLKFGVTCFAPNTIGRNCEVELDMWLLPGNLPSHSGGCSNYLFLSGCGSARLDNGATAEAYSLRKTMERFLFTLVGKASSSRTSAAACSWLL